MNSVARIVFESILAGKMDKQTGISILEEMKSGQPKEVVHDIAVIGVSARFPQADSVDRFWDNLKNGVDCVTPFPPSRRKDTDPYVRLTKPGTPLQYYDGAYLDEIDKFDNQYFRVSPKEASCMSPYHRIFLEGVWHLLEDAGYSDADIRGTKTGVYMGYSGDSFDDYKDFIMTFEPEAMSTAFVGNMSAMISGRISHMLDLKGPNMLIDTACSASLCAVELACQALRNKDCDMAIAGGIRLIFLRLMGILDVGIESSVNRARTFDNASDGTGAGEGMGMVFLKPYEKAVRDGDHIYAVIKGIAMNQDGNSIGLTAPNVIEQENLIVSAWKDAGVAPETISYIEAHGTGTKLGDPIEIEGLQRAFRRYTAKKQFCAIGSVKTNIGHLDGTAGIAGLIKAILALKHGELPPSLHFSMPNRNIKFEESPVYVNYRLQKWETDGHPRRCGVSSFGLSGTNCHLILEEAPQQSSAEKADSGISMLTLSAKSRFSYETLLRDFAGWLEKEPEINMNDFCYTASACRNHYPYRLAVLFTDREDLLKRINTYLSGGIVNPEEGGRALIFSGMHQMATGNKRILQKNELSGEDKDKLNSEAELILGQMLDAGQPEAHLQQRLAYLYVNGADVDWKQLYKGTEKKTRLPLYPFEKTRCWVQIPDPIEAGLNQTTNNICNAKAKAAPVKVLLRGRQEAGYSETERNIAQIWGAVLGFHELDVYDGFYSLGGDSILAMKIVNQMGNELQIPVQVADVLNHSTIDELAGFVDRLEGRQQHNNWAHALEPVQPAAYYPVSPAQKRLFILNYLDGIDTAYNEPGVTAIHGKLDRRRLEEAFQALICRHESLRTTFDLLDENPVQIIHEEVAFEMAYAETDEADAARLVQEMVRPFELNRAPLFRAALLYFNEERHWLVLDIHHIISDGSSMSLIVQDLMKLYNGEKLEPLPVQYKDFVQWQQKNLLTAEMKEQETFWLQMFGGEIPVLDLPADFPRPEVQSFAGETAGLTLEADLTARMNEIAVEEGVTLYILLLAAYNILLAKYSGQQDIIVGTAVSGRNHLDTEGIVGMFVNTLAIRNYPAGGKAFRMFLQEVREHVLAAFSNQDYPLDELIAKLALSDNYSRNPLFGTMFIMQNSGLPVLNSGSLILGLEEIPRTSSKFDCMMEAYEMNGELHFVLTYCTRLFKRSTMEQMMNDYTVILRSIASKPDIAIKQIDLGDKLLLPGAAAMDFNFQF